MNFIDFDVECQDDNDLLDPLGIQNNDPTESLNDALVCLNSDSFSAIIGDAFTQTEIQNDK